MAATGEAAQRGPTETPELRKMGVAIINNELKLSLFRDIQKIYRWKFAPPELVRSRVAIVSLLIMLWGQAGPPTVYMPLTTCIDQPPCPPPMGLSL